MMVSFLIALVRFYQRAVSPLLPMNCRYQPTCSGYMIEAAHRFGAFKGGCLGVRRILRCHPFSNSGREDPVPEVFAWNLIFGYKRGNPGPQTKAVGPREKM